jgi:hypothetical protein
VQIAVACRSTPRADLGDALKVVEPSAGKVRDATLFGTEQALRNGIDTASIWATERPR